MTDISHHNDAMSDIDEASPQATRARQYRAILPAPLRYWLGRISRMTLSIAALALAAAIGHVSAYLFVSSGTFLTTDHYGPWEHWRDESRLKADPYTRARTLSRGTIRLSTDVAGIYEARVDADGARLHSSCDYLIDGPNTEGLWWSLSVFDSDGMIIDNDANRYTFTADTAALNPNGSYTITLGRDARHGNWLPTGGAGRIVLVYRLLDPATGLSPEAKATRHLYLPSIRSEGCS